MISYHEIQKNEVLNIFILINPLFDLFSWKNTTVISEQCDKI